MIHDACHNRWQLAKSTLALSSVIPADTSDWQQRERGCCSWGRGRREDDEHSRQTGTRASEQLSLARPLSCRCIGQAQHTHTHTHTHTLVSAWRHTHTRSVTTIPQKLSASQPSTDNKFESNGKGNSRVYYKGSEQTTHLQKYVHTKLKTILRDC